MGFLFPVPTQKMEIMLTKRITKELNNNYKSFSSSIQDLLVHISNKTQQKHCLTFSLSSHASVAVATEITVTRRVFFWRANFATWNRAPLAYEVTIEQGRMGLGSSSLWVFSRVHPFPDTWHYCTFQWWNNTIHFWRLGFMFGVFAFCFFLDFRASSLPFLPWQDANWLSSF